MARAVLVCSRDPRSDPSVEMSLRCALKRVTPDNLSAPRYDLRSAPGLCLGVLGTTTGVETHGTSVLLGDAVAADDWHEPGGGIPDGAFALLRSDDARVELVADLAGSRTVWYLLTGGLLVASTSQRAIVTFMGDYSPSVSALSWFLSAGTLGFENGWDSRLRRLCPGERVTLDRVTWKTRSGSTLPEPGPLPSDAPMRRAAVEDALDCVFAGRDWSSPPWVLSLSGGADSRGILLHLHDPSAMRCVTYGEQALLSDPRGDGVVSSRLARSVGAPHRLVALGDSTPFERVLQRFLENTEARNDHVPAFLDGFALWANLASEGVEGVLCGDTPFTGWGYDDTLPRHPQLTPPQSREEWLRLPSSRGFGRGWEALTFADYDDLRMRALAAEFPPQTWPEELLLLPKEKGSDWRGRVFRGYQYPLVLAALNDARAAYLEVANPLLSRDLMICALAMVDPPLASTKTAFKHIVQDLAPGLPFASRASVADRGAWERRPDVQREVVQTLNNRSFSALLPTPVVELALSQTVTHYATAARSDRLRRRFGDVLRRAATPSLRAAAARRRRAQLSTHSLGMRCLLACRMDALLREDAAAGRRNSR